MHYTLVPNSKLNRQVQINRTLLSLLTKPSGGYSRAPYGPGDPGLCKVINELENVYSL